MDGWELTLWFQANERVLPDGAANGRVVQCRVRSGGRVHRPALERRFQRLPRVARNSPYRGGGTYHSIGLLQVVVE